MPITNAAGKAYETAYEMGLSTSNLHRNLGVTLERLDQTQAAEKHLKMALEMNPDDAFALNYLGYWWA
jgi:tetratricopeptide (TPR) repeat protein